MIPIDIFDGKHFFEPSGKILYNFFRNRVSELLHLPSLGRLLKVHPNPELLGEYSYTELTNSPYTHKNSVL